ncbi:microsomal signal peptidase (spc12) domain-containing protein [Toxoplasma gondii TgCatPRC2]|uniref:Signal peptidase complex subunit 1 n=4 Tax=Toxoplasma gondii TaxID=5811 RepID=A0A151HHA1_TOXGO|nr:microsomal signal peptidase (spc12) domain-containing protein [Toxoplasma gondii ME49]EPT32232.1 microsomal signal peptidase (spc12) domain-containing protein [Toxoplasma gondii ME49]KFG29854.1 microsomal signal peptidase (spc12) domain-containing protein [Toxoplasma gondii GAB2-2007-GAL-DOM2]KYF41161.1 microsomal signal peptidase (spc12) domain-containing protein [Toxoplasma gondii ARI]KYK68696.1 microsomal signal peptidase (spc12) domain-containing protein [Toxoplasma gondii TgCatPRC2]|eukprot:XP_002371681.1 microsomal signal peptidase (spc12) domain-containing protein [Toxoplasma gondii ME49]
MGISSCGETLASCFKAVKSGTVDFKGQERVYSWLIYFAWAGGLSGFFVGGILEDFTVTVYTILMCMAIAAILCFPSWPCFHRHPVEWTPHDPARLAALFTQHQTQEETPQKGAGKKRGKKSAEVKRKN